MDCNSFVTHLLSSQLYSSMAYLSAETLAGQSMTVKRTDKCGSPASPQMIGIELAKSSPNMGYSNQNITNDDLVGDLCVASYFGWRSPLPVIIFSTIVEAANRSYCSLVGTWCQGTIGFTANTGYPENRPFQGARRCSLSGGFLQTCNRRPMGLTWTAEMINATWWFGLLQGTYCMTPKKTSRYAYLEVFENGGTP